MELPTVNNKKENSEIKKRLKVEEVEKKKRKKENDSYRKPFICCNKKLRWKSGLSEAPPHKNNAIHTKNVILKEKKKKCDIKIGACHV